MIQPREKALRFSLSLPQRRRSSLLVLALLAVVIWGCAPLPAPSALDTLTVASPALEQSALIYVAVDQGLFTRHGLNIVVKDCASGPEALSLLRAGKADIAATSEYPFVRSLLDDEPLAVIATVDKFENDYVVARPDRGITSLADLKGKRVGLMKGAIVEFYLARLLEIEDVPAQEVTVVDLAPDRAVAALAAGEVDAVVVWQPFAERAQQAVSGAVLLPAQSSQAVFGVLVAQQPWIDAQGARLERFLEALNEADGWLIRNPDAARAVVRKRLGYQEEYLSRVWARNSFGLSLDQPLVIAMKDEAQWLIRNNLTKATTLPDVTAHIHSAALEAVKPDSVTLVQ